MPRAGVPVGGFAMWFHPGCGARGGVNTDIDHVAALSTGLYGDGESYGMTLTIVGPGSARASAKIVDRSSRCHDYNLLLSPAVFQSLGLSLSWTRVRVTWTVV